MSLPSDFHLRFCIKYRTFHIHFASGFMIDGIFDIGCHVVRDDIEVFSGKSEGIRRLYESACVA